MVDLNLGWIGWLHTAACIVAMFVFVRVMLLRKGGAAHRVWGRAYVISYVVLCVTAFGIYRLQRFWFPHWLALAGLLVLASGYFAARFKPRGWRYLHIIAMLLSAYNLFGGAVNEVFLRVRFLRSLAGGGFDSPLLGATHFFVSLLFLILIVVYITATAVTSPKRVRRAMIEENS
jgi:uncharacterized membrane protein